MTFKGIFFLVLFLTLNVIGAFGGYGRQRKRGRSSEESHEDDDDRRGHGHHRHHDEDKDDDGWDWESTTGVWVLILVICAVGGLLLLTSWLMCRIYNKCRKDKINCERAPQSGTTPPAWSSQLVFLPELSVGFGLVSEGFTRIGPGQLVRTRQGTNITDGATWAVAMTKGKHLFEITWPWAHRGLRAAVGVASVDAPIKAKGMQSLVGSNCHTWGLDIVIRKALHTNKTIVTCPTDGSYVPDKFLMYVNVDEGKLGFGNDVTYWGDVITDLPKEGKTPLYVMVGATRWQAELSVVYKGSESDGEHEATRIHRPHHLPPLHPQAPPAYKEVDDCNGPLMVQPALPEDTNEKPSSPPPPYAHHHLGHKDSSDKF